jgi:hypothetical protein
MNILIALILGKILAELIIILLQIGYYCYKNVKESKEEGLSISFKEYIKEGF